MNTERARGRSPRPAEGVADLKGTGVSCPFDLPVNGWASTGRFVLSLSRTVVALATVTCALGACSKKEDARPPRPVYPPLPLRLRSPSRPAAPAQRCLRSMLQGPSPSARIVAQRHASLRRPSPTNARNPDPQAVADARCFKYRDNCLEVGYIATTETLDGVSSDKVRKFSTDFQRQCDVGPRNWDNCSGYCGVLYWGRGITKNQAKAAAIAKSIPRRPRRRGM